jgi:hypothetical protein
MWQVTAYLECSYLDRGTLDVGLVLRTLVFCSALRVTSLLPTAGLARRGRRPSGGGRYFRLAELSLLSGAFLFYTISRGGETSGEGTRSGWRGGHYYNFCSRVEGDHE